MAGYDGTGNFIPPTPPTYPAVAGTVIEAGKFNTIINSIVAALSLCVVKDGQSATSARVPFASGISTPSITPGAASEILFDGASAAIGVSVTGGNCTIAFQDPTDAYNEVGNLTFDLSTSELSIDALRVYLQRLETAYFYLNSTYGTAVAGAAQSPVSKGSAATMQWRTNCQWEEVWNGNLAGVAVAALSCGDISGEYIVVSGGTQRPVSYIAGTSSSRIGVHASSTTWNSASFGGGFVYAWNDVTGTDESAAITKIYRLT